MLSVPTEFKCPGYWSETSFQSYGEIDMNIEVFKTDWIDAVPLKNTIVLCNPNQQYESTNVQT